MTPRDRSISYMNEEISFFYYEWLCNMIDSKGRATLVRHLHKRPFYWTVPNDDNRSYDGQALRDMFVDDTQYADFELPDGDCSVLEMLIGVAVRMNDILVEIEGEDKIACWFWEIVGNLGLAKFTDDDLFEHGGLHKIDYILDSFLDRKFKKNGLGGLFPLNQPDEDQRNVEIWYQMNSYLVENYYKED